MNDAETLANILLRRKDDQCLIRFERKGGQDVSTSYADLFARALGMLAIFQQKGLKAGDKVILFVRNNPAFVDAFWACQLGGMVPVPVSAGMRGEVFKKLALIISNLDEALLFTERELFSRLVDFYPDGFGQRYLLLDDIQNLQQAGVIHQASSTDTALIQFSSGATSNPKGIVLNHANLLANIRAISTSASITGNDVTLSWMPLTHDMGLIGFHLVPLFNGCSQILMDTDLFVRRPARWLECASLHQATLLCSPNFGYQHYMKSVTTTNPDVTLENVRLIFNGAEPVSATVCRHFQSRMKQLQLADNSQFPVYGLAEASLAVTFPQPGAELNTRMLKSDQLGVGAVVEDVSSNDGGVELVCVGSPLPGCEVRVRDGNGRLVDAGRVGYIQTRGDNVSAGYCLPGDSGVCSIQDHEGWIETGDLGFVDTDGLYVTGRARDIIFVAGQNWYSQDIEKVLQEHAQLEPGKVVAAACRSDDNSEDHVLIFVQYRKQPEAFVATSAMVQKVLAEQTGLSAHVVIPVQAIPRTSSGKLQRYQLVEQYEQGAYTERLQALNSTIALTGAEPGHTPVEQQLLNLCSILFPDQHIQPDQNLFELGADSLMLVRIHEEIELRFPDVVEITDLFDYPTIKLLAAYIRRD